VFERFDASESRVAFSPQIAIFQRTFERNRGRFFFGYFLLLKQKKVTHRQVKSLLGGLANKEIMIITTKRSSQGKCPLGLKPPPVRAKNQTCAKLLMNN